MLTVTWDASMDGRIHGRADEQDKNTLCLIKYGARTLCLITLANVDQFQ